MPYSNQIKPNHINMALFAYGSFKHLLSLCDGTLPSVSNIESISRLQHLANVFEIVCLGSSPTDHDDLGSKVAVNMTLD